MLMGGVGRVQDELRANAAFVTVIKAVVLLKFALVLIDLVFSW